MFLLNFFLTEIRETWKDYRSKPVLISFKMVGQKRHNSFVWKTKFWLERENTEKNVFLPVRHMKNKNSSVEKNKTVHSVESFISPGKNNIWFHTGKKNFAVFSDCEIKIKKLCLSWKSI